MACVNETDGKPVNDGSAENQDELDLCNLTAQFLALNCRENSQLNVPRSSSLFATALSLFIWDGKRRQFLLDGKKLKVSPPHVVETLAQLCVKSPAEGLISFALKGGQLSFGFMPFEKRLCHYFTDPVPPKAVLSVHDLIRRSSGLLIDEGNIVANIHHILKNDRNESGKISELTFSIHELNYRHILVGSGAVIQDDIGIAFSKFVGICFSFYGVGYCTYQVTQQNTCDAEFPSSTEDGSAVSKVEPHHTYNDMLVFVVFTFFC